MAVHHMGLMCRDIRAMEAWYTQHFGFRRARAIGSGSDEILFLAADGFYLELFVAAEPSPVGPLTGPGPSYPGWRHLAFKVDDVDAVLAEMGDDAHITAGPMSFDAFIPGWKTVWVADPDGNIVEISQGFVDDPDVSPA
ncbi:MAG: VOC family protein [Chloroflexota bacterium]